MSWKKAVKSSAVMSMGNMGIYFEDERKKKRWESGQAILHRDSEKTWTKREGEKDNEAYSVKNSYGTLRYLKKGKQRGNGREGFVLEALEAPGTPVHTEKQKHLDRETMKKVRRTGKQTLFSSEVPFHDQALFFDMAHSKKSEKFLDCMKELLLRQGHQTLKDTFGFLDQEPERMELEERKEEQKDALSPESVQARRQRSKEEGRDTPGRRIDTLNSRLLRKEAMERQLRGELQLMLEQRTKEEQKEIRRNRLLRQQEQSGQEREKEKSGSFWRRQLYSDTEELEAPLAGETGENPKETDRNASTVTENEKI